MISSPEHMPADTHAPRYLLISREGETLLNDDGTLHYLTGSDTAEPLAEDAILARSVIRPAAYSTDAEKNSGAEVHALYCEDDTLQAIAEELNAAEPNRPEGPVQASTNGFRYYPVHRDPLRRSPGPPRLPHRNAVLRLHW